MNWKSSDQNLQRQIDKAKKAGGGGSEVYDQILDELTTDMDVETFQEVGEKITEIADDVSDLTAEVAAKPTVTANPVDEATETLSKLKVGNTTYGISGGSSNHLYMHSIAIKSTIGNRGGCIFFQILNSSPSNSTTLSDVLAMMSDNVKYVCSGLIHPGTTSVAIANVVYYEASNNRIGIDYKEVTASNLSTVSTDYWTSSDLTNVSVYRHQVIQIL